MITRPEDCVTGAVKRKQCTSSRRPAGFLWHPHNTGYILKAGLDSRTWIAWMSILGCNPNLTPKWAEGGWDAKKAKGFLCLCFTTEGWRTRPKNKLLLFFYVIAKKIAPVVSWLALQYYYYCLYFGPLWKTGHLGIFFIGKFMFLLFIL